MREKNVKRRILSVFMVLAMALNLIGTYDFGKITAYAADLTWNYGDNGYFVYEILGDGTIDITKYSGTDIEVIIPTTIDGKKVSMVGKNSSFQWQKTIERLVIPEGVERIGKNLFIDSNMYLVVEIPDSVTTIDKGAFDSSIDSRMAIMCNKESYTAKYCESCNISYFTNDAELIEFRNPDISDRLTDDMSEVEKVLAVHDWVSMIVDYDKLTTYNPSSGYYSTALGTGRAVCAAYAKVTYEILTSAGVEMRYIVSDPTKQSHAWNAALIDGLWYLLDATWDDYDGGYVFHKYFLKSDSEFPGHYDKDPDASYPNSSSIFSNCIFNTIGNRDYSYYKGYWYYVSSSGIYKAKIDGDPVKVRTLGSAYLNGYIYRDGYYYLDSKKIMRLGVDEIENGTPTVVCDLSEKYADYEISEFSLRNIYAKVTARKVVDGAYVYDTQEIQIGDAKLIPGDITKDGRVSQLDYDYLYKYLKGNIKGLDEIQKKAADLDGDGEVTMSDYNKLTTGQFSDITLIIKPDYNPHITRKLMSGNSSQIVVNSAIKPIVYTADEGYYFPSTYNSNKSLNNNGITVTRNSNTQITVSGKPTADTTILLTGATAKGSQSAPTVSDGVGKISGTTTAMEYATSATSSSWTTCSATSTSVAAGTYYVRFKETETLKAGTASTITVTALPVITTLKVTITKSSDSHMTKTVASGSETQTGLTGNMVSVIYTADTGYYFPDTYNSDKSLNKNGITVTRNSQTQITVSGTPTKDTEIVLASATLMQEILQKYKVTLDANGGNVSINQITVTYGEKIGTICAAIRKGYTFVGWYTAKSGGVKITSDTVATFTSDTTLYAHWTANKYKVTLFANGGKVAGAATKSVTVTYDTVLGTLDTPFRKGYTFTGWYTEKSGGTNITSDTVATFTANTTLYARWIANKYKVTLFANGGKVAGAATKSITVTYDTMIGTLDTPIRTGYTFAGWYTAKSGGTKITSVTVVTFTSDITLYAHWTANKYMLNLRANSGLIGTSAEKNIMVTYGEAIGTLDTPTRTGYTFAGWYTARTGGTKITENTIVKFTTTTSLYAHWTPNKYTLTLFANGGSVSGAATKNVTATYDAAIGTLGTPTRSGYTFIGWYTAKCGGIKITSSTIAKMTSNVTYYAQWKKN